MSYFMYLIACSIVVACLEWIWPARPQIKFRRWLWSDLIHLVMNGHIMGVLIYSISFYHILPPINTYLSNRGVIDILYYGAAKDWSLWIQSIVALVVIDLLHWSVHNLLHKSSWLWTIHKIHHSVKEGEMDWIVSFRFSWVEPLLYKSFLYFPLMYLGFLPQALFCHAIIGTLIGHLNHANLAWDYGIFRYLLNSPRMHLYHHAYDAPQKGQNFGIIFSCWDWIFGTAYLPEQPCPKIGFLGDDKVPQDFFGQFIWPLKINQTKKTIKMMLHMGIGGGLLLALYRMSLPF